MAASSGITHRISISGGAESKKTLQEIAAAGERVGPALRASLQSATAGGRDFENSLQRGESSSRQLGFAVTNLSFQVNDVATSLASGSSIFQVFAQQTGQIVQAFQQGGGAGPVLRAFGQTITNLITPFRLALAGSVALVAGIVLILSRTADAAQSVREFDVILAAMGKTGKTTGKDLEDAAQRLREVGLTGAEAHKALAQALREGVDPAEAEKIVKIGANLNAVLGEGSLERFISAAGKGGAPLREFAVQLGILPKEADKTARELDSASKAIDRVGEAIAGVQRKRDLAIKDERARAAREEKDRTRLKGTPQEEAAIQSARRIKDINRDTNRALSELYRQRNAENAKKLDEYNKMLEDRPPSDASLIRAIEGRVKTSARDVLGDTAKAMRDLAVEWNKLINALARSPIIEAIVKGLASIVTWITKLIAHESGIPAIGVAIVAFLPVIGLLKKAFFGLTASLGPVGLAIAAVSVIILLVATNWDTIVATLDAGWKWLQGLFKGGAGTISTILSDLWASITTGLSNLVSGAGKLVSDLFTSVGEFGSGLLKSLSDITTSVFAWFKEQTDSLFKLFEEVFTEVTKWIDETIKSFLDKVKEVFGAVSTWIKEKIDLAFRAVLDGIGLVIEWFTGFRDTVIGVFTSITTWIGEKITQWLGWFQGVIAKAVELAKAVAGAIGGSKQVEAAAAGGGQVQAAGGGRIVGPGTGTSDSILARVSHGEFIVKALATKKFLPLLQAINRGLGLNTIRRLIPKYAIGGTIGQFSGSGGVGQLLGGIQRGFANVADPQVMAGRVGFLGGRQGQGATRSVTLNLHIGGQTFRGLNAPEDVANDLVKASRKETVAWIGRKPGWYGA